MAFGLPPLLNQAAKFGNTAVLLVSDALQVLSLFSSKPMWGIYLDGKQILIPDNIESIEYKQDWRVADHPMEQGAFASYNKVATPYDARVRMTKGGSDAQRQLFLDKLASIAGGLDLYTIIMPEQWYTNANIVRYDYRRTAANGVGLVSVEIWLQEIRIAAKAALSSSKAASAVPVNNGGTVQAQPATTAQTTATQGTQ